MEIVLVILFVVLVMGTVAGVASSRRRTARRPGLEPPPESRRPVQPPRPTITPEAPPEAEEYVDDRPEITPEVTSDVAADVVTEAATAPEEVVAPPPVKPRFRDRLGAARGLLSGYWTSVRGHAIDDDTWDELEEALIRADVGVGLTTRLLDDLRGRVKTEGIDSPDALIDALKEGLKKELAPGNRALRIEDKPTVWLFVGVNGVGKTTTIGKLGLRLAAEGRTVTMAAADTFRAAAAEQLSLWAERVGADVVRGAEGGDPGSVVFDAVERAAAKGIDVVLADTAGRLHTKVNLVEELKKVKRIAERPPG
ncbi:MAG TPA: signal recognition particle receptor subunit alpha, partial [Acidimicrobiales bacterium]|nr:signal recognition particle receptor subunit alpha [Acidimicrobiales bacterium]